MWNITHSLVLNSLYYSSGHKSWKCCATCILYINIYTVAVLFILSAFIMPPEGHFGIIYDMDLFFFFLQLFCSCLHLLPFSIRTVLQYSRMGLLPLAVFNTERACFLIIFSSLCWHWFMRVMSDTPPSAGPPTRHQTCSFFSQSTGFFAFLRLCCWSGFSLLCFILRVSHLVPLCDELDG